MSIIDTLIIDRTQADAELARRLGAMGWTAMTDEQRALYLSDQLKGAYKASDLNRVNAAMDYLVGRLKAQGINVPIKRSKIPHKQSSGKRLPEGHNELKWIESTGTQWINSLFKPSGNTRVVLSAYNTSSNSGWTFGAWDSISSNQFAFSCLASYSFRYGASNVQLTNVPVGELEVDFNKNNYSLNGTTGSLTEQSFSCSYSLYLFCINAAGSASSGKFTGRINACQIYDNDTLVRDYIPDMLDSGEVGLYDMVEGKFYPNAGTGVFLAGDVADTSTSEVLDDYTWYDSDVPTPAQLTENLANVSSVRSALRAALPEIPADMDDFTIAEANNIELVLVNVEQLINNMMAAYRHCGVTVCGMGGLFL